MSKCIGCGVELQNIKRELDGYVSDLSHNLCERCFLIKNYNKNTEMYKSNIDYMKIIDNITDDDVVVYVSSLLTLNLNYLERFKNVILVLTKRDVLPKSIKDGKIINYISKRYTNIIDVIVVSAFKKFNLDILYDKLKKIAINKNIYFVGITNSGKSTLLNEMIKSYSGVSGEITTSNYPSTTLDVVDISIGELMIKDTPGIVIDNSLINYLDNNGIKKINSKKEIKPITFQISGKGAILVDEMFRIEYETDTSSMTFYMSNNLDIGNISLKNPRLNDCQFTEYIVNNCQDLVIEDVGFIKITNGVKLRLFCKDKVYVYLRDNLI